MRGIGPPSVLPDEKVKGGIYITTLLRVLTGLVFCYGPLFTCGCYSIKTIGMKKEVVLMEVTAYCACKECCNWRRKWGCFLCPPVYASGPSEGKRKKVGITSDGSEAEMGVIAADTRFYAYGTIMYVPGYGWGEVHDTGMAIKGQNRIDLFFSSHKKAMEWGRRTLKVKVYR
jgi:3D (Asp-Asp-Asp) domain-containing protein